MSLGFPTLFKGRLKQAFLTRDFPKDSPVHSGLASELPLFPALKIGPEARAAKFLVTLPFMEKERQAFCSHYDHPTQDSTRQDAERTNPSWHCIDATHFAFENPEWEPALQRLAQKCGAELGIYDEENVVAVASHLFLCGPDTSLRIQSLEAHPEEFGTLAVQLPSVFEGGGLAVQLPRDGGKHVCQMGVETKQHQLGTHYAAMASDVTAKMRPLSEGAILIVVYSLRYTDLEVDLFGEPDKLFQVLCAMYHSESVALQLDYIHNQDPLGKSEKKFVRKLQQAQKQSPARRKRFDMLVMHEVTHRHLSHHHGKWKTQKKSRTISFSDLKGNEVELGIVPHKLTNNGKTFVEKSPLSPKKKLVVFRRVYLAIIPTSQVARRLALGEEPDDVAEWAFEQLIHADTPSRLEKWFLELVENGLGYADIETLEDMLLDVSYEARLQWLSSASSHEFARNIELFDFWGDKATRNLALPFFKCQDLDGDETDIEALFAAITPALPRPWQTKCMQKWVEEAFVNMLKKAESHFPDGEAVARVCLRTSEPELNLERYASVCCKSALGLSYWYCTFDEGVMKVPEFSTMYPPIRARLFERFAQASKAASQIDDRFWRDCEEKALTYFLQHAVAMPNGQQLCAPAMSLLLNTSDVNETSRQKVINACFDLPLPRMSELCQLQTSLLAERHRSLRVLPWRMPFAQVDSINRGDDDDIDTITEFLHSAERTMCLKLRPDTTQFRINGHGFSVEYQMVNPEQVRINKTMDVYTTSNQVASDLGLSKQLC